VNKSVLFLRIASVLTLIHAVLHTVGGVFGNVPPGPASVAALAMKTNEFVALGETRSFWEFYRGMGLAVSIFLTAESVVFWLLASLARRDAVRLRPVLAVFAIAYVVFAVDSYFYFFLAPVVTELLIAGCLVAAMVTAYSAGAVDGLRG
jgi:DMSO/TMAO reductase YedYZ heme-binding membrane subunit